MTTKRIDVAGNVQLYFDGKVYRGIKSIAYDMHREEFVQMSAGYERRMPRTAVAEVEGHIDWSNPGIFEWLDLCARFADAKRIPRKTKKRMRRLSDETRRR